MYRVPVNPTADINPESDFPENAYTYTSAFDIQLTSMDKE